MQGQPHQAPHPGGRASLDGDDGGEPRSTRHQLQVHHLGHLGTQPAQQFRPACQGQEHVHLGSPGAQRRVDEIPPAGDGRDLHHRAVVREIVARVLPHRAFRLPMSGENPPLDDDFRPRRHFHIHRLTPHQLHRRPPQRAGDLHLVRPGGIFRHHCGDEHRWIHSQRHRCFQRQPIGLGAGVEGSQRRIRQEDAQSISVLDHHAMDAHAPASGGGVFGQHHPGGDEGAGIPLVVGEHRQHGEKPSPLRDHHLPDWSGIGGHHNRGHTRLFAPQVGGHKLFFGGAEGLRHPPAGPEHVPRHSHPRVARDPFEEHGRSAGSLNGPQESRDLEAWIELLGNP